jgi:ArsR family transcriptional regulator
MSMRWDGTQSIDICQYIGYGANAGKGTAVDVQTITACCEPVTEAPLAQDEAQDLAAAFKVLSDPVRLRLLSLVAAADEVCACDLVEPLGRSQPTVSHHLSVLTDAGLLEREKRGRWAWFRVVPERLKILSDALAP